jgi:glucose-6-phosphate isomerase
MSKEIPETYTYEDNILRYEFRNNDFTNDLYKEFDHKAVKLGLNSKIDDLLSGKVVNLTENQAAFHPKYRKNNGFINEFIKSDTDFASDTVFLKDEALNNFANEVAKSNAENIVSLGIGGSYEGPKLLIESLGHGEVLSTYKHHFVTGSDRIELDETLKKLDPKKTVFIVSSKSFTTDETIESLKDAIHWSGDINKFIAITANKNEAQKYNFKHISEFDKEIGGRYSIWSRISFAAAFYAMRADSENTFDNFCLGGSIADSYLSDVEDYQKFVKMLAFSDIWFHNFKEKNTRAILSYDWKLRSLPNYFQQLEMESLGKRPNKNSEFKKTGQIIFGGYGPTAQHSYFQLLHQGTQNICADIILNKDNEFNGLAYSQGITQARLLSEGASTLLKNEEIINGNVPVNLFIFDGIDAKKLGFLIATWEHRVFITSVMLQINPFDQFGVNAGKIYTKKYQIKKD